MYPALLAEAHGLAGRCEVCQRLFPRARTGRPRQFCDGACRQQHHRYFGAPADRERAGFRDTTATTMWWRG